MHDVWLIGFAAGAGASFGLLLAGVLGSLRGAAAIATFGAAAAGAGFGLIFGWPEAVAGTVGGLLGGFGATMSPGWISLSHSMKCPAFISELSTPTIGIGSGAPRNLAGSNLPQATQRPSARFCSH